MIRGGGIAASTILGFLFARRGLGSPIGLFGVLIALAIAGFLVCAAPWMQHAGPAWWISSTICHYAPLFFWLFSRAFFDDIRRFSNIEGMAAAIYSLLVMAYIWAQHQGNSGNHSDFTEAVNDLFRLTGLGIGLYVMFDVIREYRNDLIERRRKARLYMVGAVGTLFTVLVINNIVSDGRAPGGWFGSLVAASLLALSVGLILMITRPRRDILPVTAPENTKLQTTAPTPTASKKKADDPPEFAEEELAAVIAAMEQEKVYRDETLTIVSLAAKLGTQEYLLRRVINGGLEQRNFTSFLNGYRLQEIEEALSDPARVKIPILTLALEAGFNSIGPFNRAFKDKHGITPKQYRQRALEPSGK
ncbi:MAG: helix-turn-helix transcriptional regulator [Alphaproteobacteria bacterium]|nr:helix-turn-helix transcriptional regulator [Alphaproteobacteria bacterium]